MTSSYSRLKLMLAAGAVLLGGGMIFFALTWANYIRESNTDWDYVKHTREVIQKLQEMKISLLEIENSERGYLITGRDVLVERNEKARSIFGAQSQELKRMIADNASQVGRVNAMEPMVTQRLDSGTRLFELRDDYGLGATQPLIVAGVDQAQSERIVTALDEMLAEEYRLLEIRRNKFKDSLDKRSDMAVISGVIIVILMCALAWAVRQDLRLRASQLVQMDEIAHHDALTGLANRRHFVATGDAILTVAQRQEHMAAVLMLDLDGFKGVNDAYGHASGDLLLKQVAARIKVTVRGSDLVARLGGDEFVIMLPVMDSVEGLKFVAEKLLDSLSQPYALEGQDVSTVGTSIGLAWYPDHGDTLATLMHHADMALYEAKRAGKRRYAIYDRRNETQPT